MKFSTSQLVIRSLTENDAQDLFQIRSNTEINRFLHRDPPKNSFEALDFILNIRKKAEHKEILFLGISELHHPKIIGTMCLWKFSADRITAELGYELLPEFQRKGLMSNAVEFLLNYGFSQLNLEKIDAFTNKNNFSSIRLLQKFNFTLNTMRKDEIYPENLIFELNSFKNLNKS